MQPTTSSLIKISDIKNGVYVLEDGGLRTVLAVPGINFSLLAESEKEMVIGQFKELLDGLDFPIQILVISRLANIENYLSLLDKKLEDETEQLIRVQLEEYTGFIKDYVEKHKIMKKLFYIIVSYDAVSLTLGGKFSKSAEKKQDAFEQQLEQLEMRVIYISEKLSSIGLQPIKLSDAELTQLLFEMYNPSVRWGVAPVQLFEELSKTNI
ncbi:MAG: hypothetical protein AAB371_02555 [Patescibacteria group bacterium]